MNDPIPQELYPVLHRILTAIGIGICIYGVLNVLEGAVNNVSDAQELGERQIKTGRNLFILAAYIKKGTLPDPETIEYLNARRESKEKP